MFDKCKSKLSVFALILVLLIGTSLALAQDSDLANVDPSGGQRVPSDGCPMRRTDRRRRAVARSLDRR